MRRDNCFVAIVVVVVVIVVSHSVAESNIMPDR